MEKREAIVKLYQKEHSCRAIVEALKPMKVSKSNVSYTIQRFKETNSFADRPKSGRPRSVRTKKLVEATRIKIHRNNKRSIRKMALEVGVNREVMRKIVREDLGVKPYHLQKRQLLSDATVDKRLERSKVLRNWLKSRTRISIIWTDEKVFTLQAAFNSQNDRILAKDIRQVPVKDKTVFKRQKPASVMVWAGVTTCGRKTPLIFIPEGVKINQKVYLDMMSMQVLPWIKKQEWEDSYCFQQDGAPSHTAKLVQDWCHRSFEHFWSKD
ncbi:Putative DD37D maT transposase, partial [Caligus rogercresseyi]